MGIACAVYVLAGACCIFHTAAAHQLPGDSQAHFEQQTAQQSCQAAAERTSVTLDALCPVSDRPSSACCDKLAAFESTQCFCVLRPEREAAHPGQDALARMLAAYATCFSIMPTCDELSVDTGDQAFQAGAEAADEYRLPLDQVEAQEARKLPLEMPAAFLSEGSSQPPQQPEDADTEKGWASSLKSLVQQVVPFKSDFAAAGGRKMGLRSRARRTKLQETVAEPVEAHVGASQLQQLSTTMDMDIQVAISNRSPGGTAKLLLRGRGSSLRLSAPSEMLMSRDWTGPQCWMVGAMLAVCAGLVCLGAGLGSWARQVRLLAFFTVPLLGEQGPVHLEVQGPVHLEVQGQGLQKRLSSPSLSSRSQVFANPAADARSCQQQTGEE